MVGLVPGDLGEAYINQHIALARPASAIFSQYVALALTAPFSLGRLQAAQRGIKNSLGLDDIRNLRVPLPPIAEQKRIVAKVDQLMALCDDLEARQAKKRETAVRLNRAALDALTTAEGPEEIAASFRRIAENFELVVPAPESMGELRNAILSLAVQGRLVARRIDDEPVGALLTRVSKGLEQSKTRGKGSDDFEPVDSEVAALGPAHWRWEKLGRLAEVVGGVAKGRDLNGRRTVSYPYLRVANVQRGSLDLTEVKEIEIPPEELPRYNLRPGDVLFTEGGDWDKLGRSAVWEGRVDPCLHQNHVFRARFAVGDLNPRWFSMYANSPLGRRYFEGAAKRTTNLASINMTQLRNCPMPVPPTNEQKRIVAKVDQLMALCDSLEAALRRTEGTAQKLAEAVVAEIVA
jgi:type I restriction enzyme S subunit